MGDAEQQRVRELLAFLGPETRSDVKAAAVRCVAGLTGSREGRQLLLASAPGLVGALLALTGRDPGSESGALAREAYGALINLAAEEPGAGAGAGGALQAGLPDLLDRLLDRGYPLADQVAALLANLSREEASGRHLLAALQLRPQPQPQQGAGPGPGLARLMDAFCTDGFNAGASLHHVGPLLANLTQLPEARSVLLDTSRCLVQRLLPYTQYAGSVIRRRGAVGTLRNCCFDYRHHAWLLSGAVDLLPSLLLPLAGPEEFPEDETERLPLDLQYLPPEKQREPEPDIRKMLLEAILLLTATKPGRELVREKGTYVILRALHKHERDPGVAAACEKLIQVLISDEPEAGMENLLEVEVPADVEEQLQRQDREEETGPEGRQR